MSSQNTEANMNAQINKETTDSNTEKVDGINNLILSKLELLSLSRYKGNKNTKQKSPQRPSPT